MRLPCYHWIPGHVDVWLLEDMPSLTTNSEEAWNLGKLGTLLSTKTCFSGPLLVSGRALLWKIRNWWYVVFSDAINSIVTFLWLKFIPTHQSMPSHSQSLQKFTTVTILIDPSAFPIMGMVYHQPNRHQISESLALELWLANECGSDVEEFTCVLMICKSLKNHKYLRTNQKKIPVIQFVWPWVLLPP